ncbi:MULTISPECIES: oligosaccharide flippase family protein [unclassified Methylobacterium]|uniref:oligosaccharide flippase family protein n=1 Tax=unclassified Methylobacterium TaxID=2615210 RepID=UPI00226A45BC|nr:MULTISPECIES: oligosaccharide flippase family protein [unclassified Methylobacterium]
MSERNHPSESVIYSIVRAVVDSVEDSTAAQRNEIYARARRALADIQSEGSQALDSQATIHFFLLETAIHRIESEFSARPAQEIVGRPALPADLDKSQVYRSSEPSDPAKPDPSRPGRGHGGIVRNIGAGSLVSLIKIAVQLALLPIMAHLLGPKEFGIYALAMPVVSFLAVIADGGVGISLARDTSNSPDVWSTAFWVLMASGVTLGLVVLGSGYALAYASAEPELIVIMAILSLSFPFLSASVLPLARLTREGNLVSSSKADFLAAIMSACAAVTLGSLGFGARSLAVQYVTGYLIRAVILNLYAFELPRFVFKPATIHSHLSSGGVLIGGRLGDLMCRFGENLLFGNAFGPTALGAYNFANQVPRFLFEAFSNPTWAAFYAQTIRESRERLQEIYYKICRFMAFLTFPAAAMIAASGSDILAFVLGPKWSDAGTFLQVLAPGYALSVTASMGTALLLTLNANWMFLLSIAVLSFGRVAGVGAGYFIAPAYAAAFVGIANLIYAVVITIMVSRVCGAEIRTLLRNIAGAFIASTFAFVTCKSVLLTFGDRLPIVVLALATGIVSFIVCIIAIEGRSIRAEFNQFRSTLKHATASR